MKTHVQAFNNTKDTLAYREANAKHIHRESYNGPARDYHKGLADGFAQSRLVLQSECDGLDVRPQAQASIQLVPGRAIIRVGDHLYDMRDCAAIEVLAAQIVSLYMRCEISEESYCILCDAEALKIAQDANPEETSK